VSAPRIARAGRVIDRRTFLKALGLGGLGLAAGGVLGSRLAPLVTSVAAQTSPIDDLALQLQFDPERIFRFVADQIRYQPYAGLLRGPVGTLMTRAGNSVDQSALLAALLRASGLEARFAQGALDDAAASAVLGPSASDRATAYRELGEAVSGTGEGGRPASLGPPDAAVQARLDAAAAAADAAVAWSRAELDTTVALIQATLASGGIMLPSGVSEMPMLERSGHTWVRVATGSTWLDLDPSAPGAMSGDSMTTAASEHDEMPDDLRHRITFAVIGETIADGSLQEEGLLEMDAFADSLGGVPIGFMNIQHEGLKALGTDIMTSLEGGTIYLPSLLVGDTVVVGPGALRFGGDTSDPFGDLESSTPDPQEGEPTAEWVQITISSPGSEPVVVRREMFDRLGPAARAAATLDLTLLAPAGLVDIEPGMPPDFLPAQRTHWLTVQLGTIGGEALSRAVSTPDTEALLASVVHGYHLMREATGAEVGLPSGFRPFVDAPNVVALTIDQEHGQDGGLLVRPTIDIWHRSYGSTLVTDAPLDTPPGLVNGVLSHVAERLLAGDTANAPSTSGLVSVGAVFDRALADAIPIRLVRHPDEAAELPFSADALARLRAALSGDRVVIVPEQPIRFGQDDRVGWWIIDRVSGSAIDQMDDGRGSEGAEGGTLLMNTIRMVRPMRDLGLCVGMTVLFTSLLITSVAAVGAGYAAGGGGGALLMAYGVAGSAVGGGSTGGLLGGVIAC